MSNTKLNFEINRKAFHLCALFFPCFYIFTTKITMCIMLLIITSLTLYCDIYRHSNNKIKELIGKFLGFLLRNYEKTSKTSLTGASYMAIGLLLSCVFFSKGLAISSWLILIISDSVAAIIGMKFGKPLYNDKSLEGSFAFFFSALLVSVFSYFLVSYHTSFSVIIISCLITTIIEFFSGDLKINDNLSIPMAYAISTIIFNFFK